MLLVAAPSVKCWVLLLPELRYIRASGMVQHNRSCLPAVSQRDLLTNLPVDSIHRNLCDVARTDLDGNKLNVCLTRTALAEWHITPVVGRDSLRSNYCPNTAAKVEMITNHIANQRTRSIRLEEGIIAAVLHVPIP